LTRYLALAEYFWLAEEVTGTEAAVLVKASRVELADSALHAPAAGFGDQDFYPDLLDKAAVLTCRLARTLGACRRLPDQARHVELVQSCQDLRAVERMASAGQEHWQV
jgi:hypothetical protein